MELILLKNKKKFVPKKGIKGTKRAATTRDGGSATYSSETQNFVVPKIKK